jgi:hypothetical protein
MIVIAADCAIRRGLVQSGVIRRAGRRFRWRWVRRRWAEFEADCLHVLMGVAMAGMLLPQLRILPARVWEAVFGLGAAWFGWRAFAGRVGSREIGTRRGVALGRLGGGAPFAHVIECVAMMFMLLPAVDDALVRSHPFGRAMAGMGGSGLASVAPAVALLLALCLVGYVVWTTDGLARARVSGSAVGGSVAGGSAVGGSAGGGSAVAVASGVMAPRLAAFSTIAMALTMGYMLIQMA